MRRLLQGFGWFVFSFLTIAGILILYRLERPFDFVYAKAVVPGAAYLAILIEVRDMERTPSVALGLGAAAVGMSLLLAWWTPMDHRVALALGIFLAVVAPFSNRWLDWF